MLIVTYRPLSGTELRDRSQLKFLTAYTLRMTLYPFNIAGTSQGQRLVHMFARTKNHLDARVLCVWNAVF
jgi:hypothetical protein